MKSIQLAGVVAYGVGGGGGGREDYHKKKSTVDSFIHTHSSEKAKRFPRTQRRSSTCSILVYIGHPRNMTRPKNTSPLPSRIPPP